jgi:hypothetical protein
LISSPQKWRRVPPVGWPGRTRGGRQASGCTEGGRSSDMRPGWPRLEYRRSWRRPASHPPHPGARTSARRDRAPGVANLGACARESTRATCMPCRCSGPALRRRGRGRRVAPDPACRTCLPRRRAWLPMASAASGPQLQGNVLQGRRWRWRRRRRRRPELHSRVLALSGRSQRRRLRLLQQRWGWALLHEAWRRGQGHRLRPLQPGLGRGRAELRVGVSRAHQAGQENPRFHAGACPPPALCTCLLSGRTYLRGARTCRLDGAPSGRGDIERPVRRPRHDGTVTRSHLRMRRILADLPSPLPWAAHRWPGGVHHAPRETISSRS